MSARRSIAPAELSETRFLSMKEVEEFTGWSVWTIRRYVKLAQFPPPHPLAGFRLDWVKAWRDGKTDWKTEQQRMRAIPAPRPLRVSPQLRNRQAAAAEVAE